MRRVLLAILLAGTAPPAPAETVIAAATLRTRTILTEGDLAMTPDSVAGAAERLSEVIGAEVRTTVYKGQPILLDNLASPAIVERNQRVSIVFAAGPVLIETGGRALQRGGAGDLIPVMNSASRVTVTGLVLPDGRIRVAQ